MHLLKSFNRGRSGNVAIYLAVIALPLLFAANFSLDYMNASRARESLQALADAVALAAVRVLPDEQAAREEGIGLWQGTFTEPADFRRSRGIFVLRP